MADDESSAAKPQQPPQEPSSRRLAGSAYNSPYGRSGAPGPHPNGEDAYASLRARALATLEGMGFEPASMVEHGVVWAEDQDPYGHVMHSHLGARKCDDLVRGRGVIIVVRKYELDIRRQVRYPDSVIVAYRQGHIEPTRNNGTVAVFSLKQQAIVATIKGATTYIDVKTGRPPALYEAYVQKSEDSKRLQEKWDAEHPKPKRRPESKI
ncbi:hypothetical protein F4780DRAFT_772437 [Xylariomycetidae sp. FL0641]|nr:hypothetical protein F4780DRAFT_772437 [Xylariomycetidae sp. FL0641]